MLDPIVPVGSQTQSEALGLAVQVDGLLDFTYQRFSKIERMF